jgi:hypothetical protein
MKNTDKQPEGAEERDSWSRFERAVDAAVKSGPMHKAAAPTTKPMAAPNRRAQRKPKTKD